MGILRKFNEYHLPTDMGETPEAEMGEDMPMEDEATGDKPYVDEGKALAEMLGIDYSGGRMDYKGKEVMFASETNTFLVGGKNTKVETAEEMEKYLKSGRFPQSQAQIQESRKLRQSNK